MQATQCLLECVCWEPPSLTAICKTFWSESQLISDSFNPRPPSIRAAVWKPLGHTFSKLQNWGDEDIFETDMLKRNAGDRRLRCHWGCCLQHHSSFSSASFSVRERHAMWAWLTWEPPGGLTWFISDCKDTARALTFLTKRIEVSS